MAFLGKCQGGNSCFQKIVAKRASAEEPKMVYAVISNIRWGSSFGESHTGTVRLVNKGAIAMPQNISCGDVMRGDPTFYDETHWATLQEARENFDDVRRSYSGHPNIRCSDET